LRGIYTCKDHFIPFGLLIVADGMGGHAYGREASQIAIQTVTQAVMQNLIGCDTTEEPDDAQFIAMLTHGVEQANQAICAFSEEMEKGKDTGMGTTLTAALVLDATAYVVNVGDSRTYLYREGEGLSQITKDHSLVARLVETEQIEPDDIYTHPKRNQIYRSVGNPGGIDVDWFIASVRSGDRLLLCSDGLWEMVRDGMIEQIVGSKANVAVISERLVSAALNGGGADNISVVVAEVV
jgi:PPM family protein phosphatase